MPKQIRYIDLFSGPGFYEDGNPSTPILIGRYCQKDDFLRSKVRLIFNDNTYSSALRQNFANEFPATTFNYKPHFGQSTVGECKAISDYLTACTVEGKFNEYPSLLFIDPFGYKGIETTVLADFLKNWGNEIFIFVNTKRIHPALENDKFDDLMQDLFPSTLSRIRNDRRFKSSVSERLSLIIDGLGKEYQSLLGGTIYYTAFRFQEEDNTATSHYILHITKGTRGYDLIKTTYNDFANVGTVFDGINTYTFDAKLLDNPESEMFDMSAMNIDKLKDELYKCYQKAQITAYDLFEEHQKNSLYCRSHYTEALRQLVSENKLQATFTDGKNHKTTVLISKDCKLIFN
jgi:three-Cys-motif partner protein